MKFLKRLLILLLGLAVIFVIVGFFLPKQVNVERSISIDAPPHVVYGLVDNFERFNEWSPWAKMDPDTKYTYSGPESGVGAKLSWESDNPNVGSGYQEIIEAIPDELVKNHLDFGENGKGNAAFLLKPEGEGTHVTWAFETDFGQNLIGRYFGLFMDKMLGPHYEEGLASLKKLAESMPKMDFSDLDMEVTEVASQTVAYKNVKSEIEPQAISALLGAAFGEIVGFIQSHGVQIVGQPMTINRGITTEYNVDAAMPINQKPDNYDENGAVKVREMYAGKVLKVIHVGAYTNLAQTHEKAMAYLQSKGWQAADASWEVYVSDPGNTAEEDLITHVFIPINQ